MKKLEATTILTRGGFGPGSVFGFNVTLLSFGLLPPIPKTDPLQVRHMLGFGFPALPRWKDPLTYSRLLHRFGTLPAPHNPQVEEGRPLPFKSFWADHFL